MTDARGSGNESYDGSYFSTVVEANNQQHFFIYRLDMDVDGQQNAVAEMNTVSVPIGLENPYGNALVAQMSMFKKEQEAQRNANASTNRMWMIMNHHVKNKFDHMSSYMLMPSAGITPLAEKGSSLYNRAGALYHHFWATPYHPDEMYPAGDYPSSNQKHQGLPA